MSKKIFKSMLLTGVLLTGSLATTTSILPILNQDQAIQMNANTKSFVIEKDNLETDIESLSFYVNLTKQTINYDIAFKNHDFDNTTVNSFYFYAPGSVIYDWDRIAFPDSYAKVENKHAQNEASYDTLFNLNYDGLYGLNDRINVGVAYQKDGEVISSTKHLLGIKIHDVSDFLNIEDKDTTLLINNNKTFANIDINLNYAKQMIKPNKITLKSKSDLDFEQEIFVEGDYDLIQGVNSFNIKLEPNYHYQDLYLEFHFQNFTNGDYLLTSDIVDNPSFIGGQEAKWDTLSIILLIVIFVFILVAITFILLILRMMQRRKTLERLNEANYFDEHYNN